MRRWRVGRRHAGQAAARSAARGPSAGASRPGGVVAVRERDADPAELVEYGDGASWWLGSLRVEPPLSCGVPSGPPPGSASRGDTPGLASLGAIARRLEVPQLAGLHDPVGDEAQDDDDLGEQDEVVVDG